MTRGLSRKRKRAVENWDKAEDVIHTTVSLIRHGQSQPPGSDPYLDIHVLEQKSTPVKFIVHLHISSLATPVYT